MAQAAIIVEDARALNTWKTLLGVVSRCCAPCRLDLRYVNLDTTYGVTNSYRARSTINAYYARGVQSILIAIDTDRFGGNLYVACNAFQSLGTKITPNILTVNEKLEDWVCVLLDKGKHRCRCCGIECLNRIIREKYEKYMMANRIPRRLANIGCNDLNRLFQADPCARVLASFLQCRHCGSTISCC